MNILRHTVPNKYYFIGSAYCKYCQEYLLPINVFLFRSTVNIVNNIYYQNDLYMSTVSIGNNIYYTEILTTKNPKLNEIGRSTVKYCQ